MDLPLDLSIAPVLLHCRAGEVTSRASHDLEDLIFVIDGRPTIVEEVQTETPLLREYLHTELEGLLTAPEFLDALPG